MAGNDDLEAFFKKKDKKAKKGAAVVNTEDIYKQLVTVTSATQAFKENRDLDDEDEDNETLIAVGSVAPEGVPVSATGTKLSAIDETDAGRWAEEENSRNGNSGVHNSAQSSNSKSSSSNKKHGTHQQEGMAPAVQQQTSQQDEWEDFEDEQKKLEALKLKFSRGDPSQWHNEDDDDEFYGDEEHAQGASGTNGGGAEGGDMVDEDPTQPQRRRRNDQTKEKSAWKLDQVAAATASSVPANASEGDTADANPASAKVEEKKAPVAQSTGAYRPPHARSTAVTVVGGPSSDARAPHRHATKKKEQPNINDAEEFPTLGKAASGGPKKK